MNPYHDPKSGRFTTSGGGGGASRGKTRGGETKRKVALRGGGGRNTGNLDKTASIKKARKAVEKSKAKISRYDPKKKSNIELAGGKTTNKELRAIEKTYLNKANRQLAEARSSTKGRRRLVRSNKSIMTRDKDFDIKSRTKSSGKLKPNKNEFNSRKNTTKSSAKKAETYWNIKAGNAKTKAEKRLAEASAKAWRKENR